MSFMYMFIVSHSQSRSEVCVVYILLSLSLPNTNGTVFTIIHTQVSCRGKYLGVFMLVSILSLLTSKAMLSYTSTYR